MRTLEAVLLALPMATALSVSAAPEVRVSLQAQDEPLRVVLKRLTTDTPTVITVDPNVPEVPVRMALREVTIDHALRLIIKQAGKNLPQLDYETAEQGFRVFFATPVAPNKAEKEDPNRFIVTARKQATPEPPPEEKPGEGGPTAEAGSPTGEQGPFGPQEGFEGGFYADPYLIDPVANRYAREALVSQVPRFRTGYYVPVFAKTNGKRQRVQASKEPYFFRTGVISGRQYPGRYGVTRVSRPRPSNPASSGGNNGTGGFGRRPL